MGIFIAIAAFACFMGLIYVAVMQYSKVEKQAKQTLRDLVLDLEGGRQEGRWGSGDLKIEGALEGRRVSFAIEWVYTGDQACRVTRFRAETPNTLASFEVSKGTLFKKVARSLNLFNHLTVGDKRFDEKYILTGRGQVKELFLQSPKLEWSVDDLFGSHGFTKVEVKDGWATCERPWSDKNLFAVLKSLSRVAALCERKPVQTKILIHGERECFGWSYGGKGARCPYCRDDVDLQGDALTACPACRTVHHAECLEEAGGCTLLGCSEAPRRVSA